MPAEPTMAAEPAVAVEPVEEVVEEPVDVPAAADETPERGTGS
jgi:hypothetical protein